MATSFVGESEQLTIDALLSHVANVTKHLREELHQLRLNLPNLIQEILKQMYDGDSLQRKPIPQVVEKDVEILHRQDDGRSQGGVQEGTLLHETQKELQRLNERIQLLEVQIRKDSALSQNGSGKLFCSRNAREAYMIEKDHNAHELRRVSEEVKSLYSVHKETFTTLEQLLHSRIEAGLAHFADRNDDLLRQMNNRLSDSHRDMNTKMEQEIRSLRENILSQVMYDREENKKRLNRACDHIRTDVETFKRQSREDLLHLRNDFEARLNRSTSYGIKGGIGMTFGSSEAEMSQNSNYGGFQRETATWKSNWETRDPFT